MKGSYSNGNRDGMIDDAGKCAHIPEWKGKAPEYRGQCSVIFSRCEPLDHRNDKKRGVNEKKMQLFPSEEGQAV